MCAPIIKPTPKRGFVTIFTVLFVTSSIVNIFVNRFVDVFVGIFVNMCVIICVSTLFVVMGIRVNRIAREPKQHLIEECTVCAKIEGFSKPVSACSCF